MATRHHTLLILSLAVAVPASPSPGRIPKVYNALITSNQNLEPSKAYPVYQPVLHDATFGFPLQTAFFYGGEFPISNELIPAPAFLPKQPSTTAAPVSPSSSETNVKVISSSTELPVKNSETNTQDTQDGKKAEAIPAPPSTQSPIPLNEFGLPPQILPISRYQPTFNSFGHLGHFTYTYPGLRFYDPFDPFGFHPYIGLPSVYRAPTNELGQYESTLPVKSEASDVPVAKNEQSTPPPEPSDLNVLNYSPKDPEIANVPPPPLPPGGLKSDKTE